MTPYGDIYIHIYIIYIYIWVNIVSGNGLPPNGIKPLSDPCRLISITDTSPGDNELTGHYIKRC